MKDFDECIQRKLTLTLNHRTTFQTTYRHHFIKKIFKRSFYEKSSNKEIYEILEIGINHWDCLTSEQKANKIFYFLAGDEEEI